MKRKSKTRATGIRTAVTRLTGHKGIAYVKVSYAKLLKIREDMDNYEGQGEFSPRKREIIATLIRARIGPAEAREIAKHCDEDPAWL